MAGRRIAVVGGGITGVAAAHHAATRGGDVVLFEASPHVGGRVASQPFAGLDHVDSGPDAFLARVPDAVRLATEVGIADELVHPERVGAAVWYDRLHDIPDGLVLGVPGRLRPLALSRLISPLGKARAALEPFLPRTSTEADSIGAFVRARFGDEVHERLVDALVGSIYATDTDRFSLAEIPQLAALTGERSLLLAARRTRSAGTASAAAAPIFATPSGGMARLVEATAEAARTAGAELRLGSPVTVTDSGDGWRVDDEPVDAVVLCAAPRALGDTLGRPGGAGGARDAAAVDDVRRLLARGEAADVVMVTLHVVDAEWPDRLRGRSGYLVPKPVQRDVTAVSFGSQKWRHWAPPTGGQILRVSLGRDGAPVLHLSDDEIVTRALADLRRHLGVDLSPREVRVTRWPGAFAQYRPHHRRWVDAVRAALPDGLFVAGAGFDGIGIPACIRSGTVQAGLALHGHGPDGTSR